MYHLCKSNFCDSYSRKHSGKWKQIYSSYHKPSLSLTPWYISAAFPFQELISRGEMWQQDITWPWISPQGWGTVLSPPSLASPCWQDSTSPARDSPIRTLHCCTFWARSRLQVMCNRYTVNIFMLPYGSHKGPEFQIIFYRDAALSVSATQWLYYR